MRYQQSINMNVVVRTLKCFVCTIFDGKINVEPTPESLQLSKSILPLNTTSIRPQHAVKEV